MFLDTKEWRNARCSGESIQARRNHIAQVIGSHLIVHGGISTQGLYLSDLMALNLSKKTLPASFNFCFSDICMGRMCSNWQ